MLLCGFGVVAVYSAISYLAITKGSGSPEPFLFSHIAKMAFALGAIVVVSQFDYKTIAKLSKLLLLTALALLVIVRLIGVSSGGAIRWLNIGSFGFQPSDMARVAIVFYVGVLLARKQDYIKSFKKAFVPIFVWILATVVLIGLEDLSTAALVLATTVIMCFVGRVSVVHLAGLGTIAAGLAIVLLLLSPNRAARVESFLGMKIFPHTTSEEVFDKQDEGFQAEQAKIAFAMGGLTGVGPGRSTQRDFLPAPYNDFIFAIIAEEYGLIGALILLALFVAILFRGLLRIARRAEDPLGLFVAVGFTTMLVLYGFVHAGVSCGLFPVTGLPMPFVSYGGTSMVASGIMVGVLLSISRYSTRVG
jgi:cell division protein FtsW